MPFGLERRYGKGHLHFITCSCYRRLALLQTVRARFRFALVGLVVMPEHFHVLMGEPAVGTPSTVMQVLKQRVSRELRTSAQPENSNATHPLQTSQRMGHPRELSRFWQSRFYDFNVFTRKKKIEKLQYMHMNPVKRGLAAHPRDWKWSSYLSYQRDPGALIQVDFVD